METTDNQRATDQPAARRVTVQEAAVLLNLSEDAVRSRLKRGTLSKEKGPDGTVFVVLGGESSPAQPATSQPAGQSDQTLIRAHLDSLQEQVDYLKSIIAERDEELRRRDVELRREAEEHAEVLRRKDTIIMTMAQRIPELEPAPETRDPSVTASEDQESPYNNDATQEAGRSSWWRRWFGA